MRTSRTLTLAAILMTALALTLAGCDDKQAEKPTQQVDPRQKVGGLAFRVPIGWKALEGADRDGARREFDAQVNQGQGLREYVRADSQIPHLDQFYICQKEPHEGQIIAWTLELPPQSEFLAKIRETEEKGVTLRQAELTSGLCRVVQVDGTDIVRVDVNMRNGAKATNLHFWSPEKPSQVTIVMVGTSPDAQPATIREAEDILASVSLSSSRPPAPQPTTTQAAYKDARIDPGEEIRATVEQYFNSYMKAELDRMLGTLHPAGPMYPQEWAIKQLRDAAAGNAVRGDAKASDVKVTELGDTTAMAKMTMKMRADVERRGVYREEISVLTVEMRKFAGHWRIWNIDK